MVFSGVERLTIHFQKSHHPLCLWPRLTSSLGSHYPDPLPTLGTSVWQACTLPGIRHPYLMEPLPCQVTWKTRIVSVCLNLPCLSQSCLPVVTNIFFFHQKMWHLILHLSWIYFRQMAKQSFIGNMLIQEDTCIHVWRY